MSVEVKLTEMQKEIAIFIFKHCANKELNCIMFCSYMGLVMARENDFFLPNGETTCDIRCSLQAFEHHFKGGEGKLKICKDLFEGLIE